VEFNYDLGYKPNCTNVVADALSQKIELAPISLVLGEILTDIHKGMTQDLMARPLLDLAREKKTKRF